MRRRVTNALTLVSAVVCVGSALLVGRSFFRLDSVSLPVGSSTYGVGTIDGQVKLTYRPLRLSFRYTTGSAAFYRAGQRNEWEDLRGIPWLRIGWGISMRHHALNQYRVLILPLWLVPLVTAVLPVRWWVRRRREGRRGFEVGAVG